MITRYYQLSGISFSPFYFPSLYPCIYYELLFTLCNNEAARLWDTAVVWNHSWWVVQCQLCVCLTVETFYKHQHVKNCSYSDIDFIFKSRQSEDDDQDTSKSSDDSARIFCKQSSPNYSTTYCQTWSATSILKQLIPEYLKHFTIPALRR